MPAPVETTIPVAAPRAVAPVPIKAETDSKTDLSGATPADDIAKAAAHPKETWPVAKPITTEPNAPEAALSDEAKWPESEADSPIAEESPVAPVVEVQTAGLDLCAEVEALPVHAVPEPTGRQILEAQFGTHLVDALSVAFITKSLVILTGAPGAGKSWIASRLLDDNARDRTVIVPVASTWRGREDLLGYVNPINGSFEATEFTHFLCGAQDAWEAGDRRARLVIFEEFNLSQPEHWLSDLLVRLGRVNTNGQTVYAGRYSLAWKSRPSSLRALNIAFPPSAATSA